MALLPILDIEDPDLRVNCSTVKFLPDDFEETLADMFETMITHRGVGLSAPQVGIEKRFFIYTLDLESTEFRVVINPVITNRRGNSVAEEGCLSYEGYTAEVARAFEITVKYLDEQMKKVERTIQGWEARIFQHEMDHLDGILFVDRMESGTLKQCNRFEDVEAAPAVAEPALETSQG
ncbi:MAG: Peptide deformylase [bacterium]|nr:Peptide deformylase [bacterium]